MAHTRSGCDEIDLETKESAIEEPKENVGLPKTENMREQGRFMKNLAVILAITVFFVLTSAAMAGGDKNRGEIGAGDTHENGCEDQPCFADAPKPGTSEALITEAAGLTTELDGTEIHHLQFIREEEKMARDVYLVLYEKWGNPVFANIAESEQAHMDTMANLLAFYGIEDPVTDDTVGAFNDPNIAALYTQLTGWGLESEMDALRVGGYIEEYDILDIWLAYGETDEERIRRVYQNLYEGSYNHLDAFVYNYESLTGGDYEPWLLPDIQYDLVMTFVTQAKQSQPPNQRKGK